MLKHVHADHSRETHVRAMAMVKERQNPPRQPSPHLAEVKGPAENLPLGIC
jgi:hypothetical protein